MKQANRKKTEYRRPPLPPTMASMKEGRLKDTPANRALLIKPIPEDAFTSSRILDIAKYADRKTVIIQGEVLKSLADLIDAGIKVDCIVTSPPYYGQRDYGFEGQIGLETHPKEYLDKLIGVFDLCWKILRDTGSFWLNIGDTYWSGKGAHKSDEIKQAARRFGLRPQDRPGDGKWARPKQLLLIPHRLAISLQERGWLVRNDNVWIKPNPVPDQVRDRCSISHEYVFHLTKSRWYYFDRIAVGRRQPSGKVLPPLDTWEVPTSSGGKEHRASFSKELVRIPILAATPPDGIVLDPFNGIGTTTLFARLNGLRSIGIDLSNKYCAEAIKSIKSAY